ncbi:hypothetical protein ABH961_004619 [Bacillus sp. RC251]
MKKSIKSVAFVFLIYLRGFQKTKPFTMYPIGYIVLYKVTK